MAGKTGAAAKPTSGNDSAATEHTEAPLSRELVNQGAGQSSEIELKVIRNEIIDFTYNGKETKCLRSSCKSYCSPTFQSSIGWVLPNSK